MKNYATHFQLVLLSLLFLLPKQPLIAEVVLTGALSGAYPTLNQALTHINTAGGTGMVTVTIMADEVLTTPAELKASNYTVHIYPSGARTLSMDQSKGLIVMNGARNVTVDGINTDGNSLTLINYNIFSTASAIKMYADASNNIIRNCTLLGSAIGSTNCGVITITDYQGITGCDNNQIIHNIIHDAGGNLPAVAIYISGNNFNAMNDSIVISQNEISNFWAATGSSFGIFSEKYNNALQITDNSFFQTDARQGPVWDYDHRPININDGFQNSISSGFVISNNFIGGSAPNAAGSPYTINNDSFGSFIGIYANLGYLSTSSIQGNVITNFHINTGMPVNSYPSYCFQGMVIYNGAFDIGTESGNLIGDTTGVGAIEININNNFPGHIMNPIIYVSGVRPCNIKNNKIGSITLNQTGSDTTQCDLIGIYIYENNEANVENNTIGSESSQGSIQMNGGSLSSGYLTGIVSTNNNSAILQNKVQNLINNTSYKGELKGIYLEHFGYAKLWKCEGNVVRNLSSLTGNNIDVIGIEANTHAFETTNTFLSISDNLISDCQVASTTTGACDLYGIRIGLSDTALLYFVIGSISDNTIYHFNNQNHDPGSKLFGIWNHELYLGDGLQINNNHISNLHGKTPTIRGIDAVRDYDPNYLSEATNLYMEENMIHDLTSNFAGTTEITGIAYSGRFVSISKNQIYDLNAPAGDANSMISGTTSSGGLHTGAYTESNNMISLGEGVNNDVQMVGIRNIHAKCQSINLWYNTVYIGGSASSTALQNSTCFERLVTSPVKVKNNIFYNARSGGEGLHLALSNPIDSAVFGWGAGFSNRNYLVSANSDYLAQWAADKYDFAGWKTVSNADNQSVSKTAGIETQAEDLFVNPASCELSIQTSHLIEADIPQNIGEPFSITTDFLGTLRDAQHPDPGAFEYPTVYTSTRSISNFERLDISPNPTSGLTQLTASGLHNGAARIKILDPLGATAFEQSVRVINGQLSLTIDLSSFSKGLYFIQLTNDTDERVEKVMVQ